MEGKQNKLNGKFLNVRGLQFGGVVIILIEHFSFGNYFAKTKAGAGATPAFV